MLNSRALIAIPAAVALVGCSSPSRPASETAFTGLSREFADEHYVASLEADFLEVSGKDFVEFAKGSVTLTPAAERRLERQALWLRANPMVSVRLVASGDGLDRVADRRLAMARAQLVQKHLVLVGVDANQVTTIDVEPVQMATKHRVQTKIDPIQPTQNG